MKRLEDTVELLEKSASYGLALSYCESLLFFFRDPQTESVCDNLILVDYNFIRPVCSHLRMKKPEEDDGVVSSDT
jgi:hypothetical protein